MAREAKGALIARVRRALADEGDPVRARAMQAYMKSTMPFHGVSAPRMRAVCKAVFAEHALADAASWQRDVLALFRGARLREERYAAIELTRERRAKPFQTLASLPMYEAMIVEGAWWDLVDPLATHGLSGILRNEPAAMNRAMRAWSVDADIWKRRSAILCQIPAKGATDLPLLYACIEPSLGRAEFFLRKAIGWALRQYAWTDPEEIVRWVEANRARLAPLSAREALKNVGDGARGAAPRAAASSPATSSPAPGARRRTGAGDPRTPRPARRPPPGSGG
jgi:3-methyladenine DNA glycosylase AlkD